MAEEKKQKTIKAADVLSKDDAPKKESKAESKPEAKAKAKETKKTRHRHTHIEHHYDENGKSMGHTVRHVPESGGQEVSYASPDLDGVHDGLEQHVGDPNAGEEAAEGAPQSAGPAGAAPAPAGPAAGAPQPGM